MTTSTTWYRLRRRSTQHLASEHDLARSPSLHPLRGAATASHHDSAGGRLRDRERRRTGARAGRRPAARSSASGVSSDPCDQRVPSSSRQRRPAGRSRDRKRRDRTAAHRTQPDHSPGRPTSSSTSNEASTCPRRVCDLDAARSGRRPCGRAASAIAPGDRSGSHRVATRRPCRQPRVAIVGARRRDELRDAGREAVRATSVKPAAPSVVQQLIRRRQVGDGPRQVPVRDRRTTAPRCEARPCRSRRRGPTGGVEFGGSATSSSAMRPPGATARASDPRKRLESDEVAQREAARRAVDVASANGELQGVGVDERRGRVSGGQHPEREVHPHGRQPRSRSSRHRSPVPQATSTTAEPCGRPRARTVLRRQPTSMRNVMIRFTRSYRGAMASNIARTARTFSSPWGRWSVSITGAGTGTVAMLGAARSDPGLGLGGGRTAACHPVLRATGTLERSSRARRTGSPDGGRKPSRGACGERLFEIPYVSFERRRSQGVRSASLSHPLRRVIATGSLRYSSLMHTRGTRDQEERRSGTRQGTRHGARPESRSSSAKARS